MKKPYLMLMTIFSLSSIGMALECYHCENERKNKHCHDKSRKCSEFQDSCTSYVQWRVPEKWSARGGRIYQISKDCDTRRGCESRQAATRTMCKRDYYNDWACVECCSGDLCNYFVKLGAGSVRASIVTTACAMLGFIFLRRIV